jgi:type IVB pilus formation R64 PilN family outer membrane protein
VFCIFHNLAKDVEMKNSKFKMTCAATLVLYLGGCAVTPKEVEAITQEKVQTSNQKLLDAQSQQKQEVRMTRVDGNYIGDTPIELPYAASLPEPFFQHLTIRTKGSAFGTVGEAAKNLNLATGIPVRVNPDVDPQASQASSASASTPGGFMQQSSVSSSMSSAAQSYKQSVRMDYSGTLLGYVKEIANSGGVEWEFKDGSIHFFRLITRSFSLSNVNPGDLDVADNMSKGGQASTGQAGGANASTTGSFSSSSQVGLRGTYSIWRSIKPALDSALSPVGKLSINEGTGTVTVTDTKDAVAKIGKIVEAENVVLGKQVSVEVRVLRVDLNKQSQVGVNLNTVYSVMKGGTRTQGFASTSQSTQVSGSAGSITFSIVDPSSPANGASVGIQALNQFGTIVSDTSSTLITTNRVPAMTGSFNTRGFLAQTTPAAGGAVGGGAGVPGLTPGSTTTGSFLRVLPTIKDNNTVLVSMSVDVSDLLGLGSASTGSGATLQQIQWANTGGTKTISNLLVGQGEAMVMAGIGGDGVTSNADTGVSGASSSSQKTKSLFVVIVTPRILKSM